MNKAINGSNDQNLFYFKEYIDKEKLISRIVNNIESKIKLVEEYKNKYYTSNKGLENIIMTKYEFLDILNEFEEVITQSLQGMKSLIVEIRNLKDKKEIEEQIYKKRNKTIKNKNITNDLNNLNYDYSPKDKNYSQYFEESTYINNNNAKINKDKNNSFCVPQGISLFTNMYGIKNNLKVNNNKPNGTKNQLYFRKCANYSLKNIPSIAINKNIINNNEISELGSKNSNEDLRKIYNNRNINFNQYKTYSKLKKTISNDSITEKDFLTYDASLLNDLKKENQNESLSINYNDYQNIINDSKINNSKRILLLHLKNKNNNNSKETKNKNNSFSQRYEVELKNTNEEKNEKLEVEIKCPIRLGIRQNLRKNRVQNENSNNDIINRFNYNRNKKEIIERINSSEKLMKYFAKKYGGNQFDSFLTKFWKDKLNTDDINNEVNILSTVFEKEEKICRVKNKKKKTIEVNDRFIGSKRNNRQNELKLMSATSVQSSRTKNRNKDNKQNYRTITPYKNMENLENKYFNFYI